jgi:hypothetical protein
MDSENENITTYAAAHDIIADLELRLMEVEEYIEEVENRKRRIENAIRMDIEIKAEDKASGLSNEKKRQIAYEDLADFNDELQAFILVLRDTRREQKELRIELGNEQRAFQLQIHGDGL